MSIVDSTIVNVLNYADSYATVQTQVKPDGYLFEPSIEGKPFAIPLSFAEIKVSNSQSNIFREGILRFDPEFEKDIYEKLGIRDWDQILSDAQIREMILKPTKEGLEKFIKVTSSSLFERIRGVLIMLENTGMYDISMRVKDVITERYKELYNNKKVSSIKISVTASEQDQRSEVDIEQLKEELAKQIRAELEQEYKVKAATTSDKDKKTSEKVSKEVAK